MRWRVEELLPKDHHSRCSLLYARAGRSVSELRDAMYESIVKQLLPEEQIFAMVSGTKWDMKDLPSSFSTYVTTLLDVMSIVAGKVNSVAPEHIQKFIWEKLVAHVMRCLIEAFSRVKKCSHNGRAQMSMDISTLSRGIDQVSAGSSSCKEAKALQSFIKAYYNDNEKDFLKWLGEDEDALNGLALHHILSLVKLEKSPISKLSRKKKAELARSCESTWKQFVSGRLREVDQD